MSKSLVVFPGQGSQFPGMGKAYFENFARYRETLEEASDASGLHLKKISFDSSESEMKESSIAQALILTTSIGMWRVLSENFGLLEKISPVYAGHSLGEYTALVAAGSFAFGEAVKAVQSRGRAMSEAVAPGVGGMRALILKESADETKLRSFCDFVTRRSGKLVALANWNTDTQVVLSGYEEGLKVVDQLAGKADEQDPAMDFKWIRRSIPLEVSGPFHSPLMEKARDKFLPTLNAMHVEARDSFYIRNVDAKLMSLSNEGEIKASLEAQICGSVKWYPSLLEAKAQGIEKHIEISPSKVLTNMASRMEAFKTWKYLSFEDPAKIEETLK